MKRKRKASKPTINVRGLKVADIVNMDIKALNKLKKSDVKALSLRLVSAANKRLKRLRNADLGKLSPAYRYATGNNGRGRFKVKNQTRNELLKQFKTLRVFLSDKKTATVKGWKAVRRNIEKRIGSKIPKTKYKSFWGIYRKYVEVRGGKGMLTSFKGGDGKSGSERVMTLIAKQFIGKKGTEDDVLKKLTEGMTKAYEELQDKEEENGEYSSTGAFFSLSD